MKMVALTFLLLVICSMPCLAQMTIDYTYDKQHRLTGASYSAEEKVFYSYDAANNLDLEIAVTDSSHLKSFMLWLSKTGGAARDFLRGLVCKSNGAAPERARQGRAIRERGRMSGGIDAFALLTC